jgi:hypothetical protein
MMPPEKKVKKIFNFTESHVQINLLYFYCKFYQVKKKMNLFQKKKRKKYLFLKKHKFKKISFFLIKNSIYLFFFK